MNPRLSEPTNRRTLRAMARFAAPFLAVLALLSLSLSSASPAEAQVLPQGELWSATMTAAPTTINISGFSASSSQGSLSDRDFDYRGVRHSIVGITSARNDVAFDISSDASLGDRAGLTLHVGTRAFPFSKATETFDERNNRYQYLWGNTGQLWSSGDEVALRLTYQSATVTPEDGELVIYEKATANTSRPGTGHFVDNTPVGETYTIVLDSAPTGTVTVTASIDKPARAAFAATNEEDDEEATKTLTFTTANWSDAQTVTVYIRGTTSHERPSVTTDTFPDAFPQLVTVSHTASGGGYDGAAIPDVEVTAYDGGNIVYYEFKDLEISVAEGERHEFTLVQTSRSDIPWFFNVNVSMSTKSATAVFDKDYEPERGIQRLHWYNAERVPDGNGGYVWRNETTFRWETFQDQLLEGDEHFYVLMERAASTDHRHLLLDGADVPNAPARHRPRVTIVDDERPGRLLAIDGQRARPITEVSSVAEEGGSPATFTVALDRWPDNLARNATVKVNVLGPESFDESAGDNGALVPWKVTPGPEDPLVFNQNTWDTPRTVTVTALDDRDDRDELAPIALQLEVSAPFPDVLEVLVRVEDDDKGVPPTAPGAPGDPEAVALEGGGIGLSWTKPEDDGRAKISGYVIEKESDHDDSGWSEFASPRFGQTICGADGARCYPDYRAEPGYKSSYRVAAVNSAGTGPWSAEVHATALPEVWIELVTTETETAPVEGTTLVYKLHRTGSAGALNVRVNISETGAMVARTYVEAAFSDGSAVKSFSIPTTADSTGENDSRVAANIELDLARYLLVQRESPTDTSRPSSVAVSVKDDDGGAQQQGALLPEVTLTTAVTAAAEGAALEFTLTRTWPTEEALGVDVRVSETGAMLAAFPSRAVIPAGQDSAAFSVLTLDDEAVEADSVVTAAIAEDAERYTVGAPFSASVTVLDDDRAPLTAEFQDAPASHNGEDAFTFRIAFSEAVAASYRTLRDHALDVTGGSVTRAKRVDGRSDLWRITIEPDSDAGVTVVLPVTNDCDAQGAVCTGDGGALSNRVELTVPGPVAEEEKAPENSQATGAPGITGTAQVGETLTADTSGIADEDGLDKAVFAYRWQSDSADISGATDATYTLADSDEGKAVSVVVSFTDDAGNAETLTSAATAAVEAKPNSPATGAPAITGTAQVGEMLTADTSGIADADGLDNAAFSYQWLADNTDLPGATGSTYTVAGADEGKAIVVKVSFTDDRGHGEELSSAATAAVEAKANSPATGQPTISGAALVGETLTADTSGIADADGLDNVTFGYQWISNDGGADSDIGGATGSTYTLASGDVGRTIKVRVSFSDDRGNGEELTSAATDAVAGLPPPPLTASLENVATSHDGESVFTFELRFSEEFGISYKTLRDRAFTVTGGTVKKAQRLEQGSNMGWRITVRPDGDGQVAIVLPETTDCDAQGAICTGDGRKLSHSLELTVSGPGQ